MKAKPQPAAQTPTTWVCPLRAHTAARERFQRSCARALETLSAESLDKLSAYLEAALDGHTPTRHRLGGI